jgi:ABC-type nitrate/sulfonate/bicarbonate transport system substrate-binding protein
MTTQSSATGLSRRTFLRRAGVSGAGLLVVPGLLAACVQDSHVATRADGKTAIDFQLAWIKSMQFAGPFMAEERGYYAGKHLGVNMLGGGPSVDAIDVVASKRAMIGFADSNEIAVARGKGVPIKAVATAFQKSPYALISLSRSPVLTLKDQYGKTVAVSDDSRPTVEALMQRQGLDPGKVKFVAKNPDPSVLADGQVNAYWGMVTDEGAALVARGVTIKSVLLADLGEPTYAETYFVTDKTLTDRRQDVVNLLAADLAGWKWAVENNDATAKIIHDRYQPKGVGLEVMRDQGKAQIDLITAGPKLLTISPDVFKANIASAVQSGLIDKSYDVSEVVDTTVLEAARAAVPA